MNQRDHTAATFQRAVVLSAVLLAALTGGIVCAAGQTGSAQGKSVGKPMNTTATKQLFDRAVAAVGPEYVQARDALIAQGGGDLPSYVAGTQVKDRWRAALVADIVTTWLHERVLCDKCTRQMRGELRSMQRPVTPQAPAGARGLAIAALGQKVTPRVLEILLKSHEAVNRREQDALFVALGKLKDHRATQPLTELLRHDPQSEIRARSATALGLIGDPTAVAALSDALLDPAGSVELRRNCAQSLGRLQDRHATPALLRTAGNHSLDAGLRKQSVLALGTLGDSGAAPAIAASLQGEPDKEVLQAMLMTLAEIGNAACIPAVDHIAHTHAEDSVREEAARTLAALRRPTP